MWQWAIHNLVTPRISYAGFLFHDVNKWQLKPADHIYVYRALGGIPPSYTGEYGQEVIHFTARIRKHKLAQRMNILDFNLGCDIPPIF